MSDDVQPLLQRDTLKLAVDLGFEFGCAMAILGFKGDGEVVPRPGPELMSVFEKLGADAELIWIIASFGDTQTDEQTLAALRRWNDRNRPLGSGTRIAASQ